MLHRIFHSYSLRLLVVMVMLPAIALIAVGFAVGRNNTSELRDYVSARRAVPAGVPGMTPDGGSARGRALFVVSAPANLDGEVQPQVLNEPLEQFNPQPFPFQAQVIQLGSGSGSLFDVYGDPAIVQALEAQRADTIGSLNNFLMLTIGFAVIAAVGAAFFLSRSVTRPVEALTAAARRMEAGDLSQRVTANSRDEIGELAQAFNAMAGRLEKDIELRRRMASDVAHELRTPLNNLSGYLDAIADGVLPPDRTTIASLQQEAATLVTLVNDVDQLGLLDAGDMRLRNDRVELATMIAGIVGASRPRATENGITIEARLEPGLEMDGDALRLGQVVRNLLENAIRHTPAGGAITITLTEEDGAAHINVDDTGSGIPEEHLPHIFDRFYRADPSRTRATGGSGLGLAIVRQIVELHGGTARAANLDPGARLFVSLPLSPS